MPNWCQNTMRLRGRTRPVLDLAVKLVGMDPTMTSQVAQAVVAPTCGNPSGLSSTNLYYEVLASGIRRQGRHLSFHHHAPMPDGLSGQKGEDRALPPWYTWALEHWGTKWDACEVELTELELHDDGTTSVEWTFDTAWGPPQEWLDTVVAEHRDVHIQLLCDGETDGALFHYDRRAGGWPEVDILDCYEVDEAREFYVNRMGYEELPEWAKPYEEPEYDDDMFGADGEGADIPAT